jgi:hypothetical protein
MVFLRVFWGLFTRGTKFPLSSGLGILRICGKVIGELRTCFYRRERVCAVENVANLGLAGITVPSAEQRLG